MVASYSRGTVRDTDFDGVAGDDAQSTISHSLGGQEPGWSFGHMSFHPTPDISEPGSGLRTHLSIPQSYTYFVHDDRRTSNQAKSRLEATLIRYFVEELSRWFDICDPDRHFARMVPQRARNCPSLLHAILTASARHLTRMERCRKPGGRFSWKGALIPDLSDDTALHYHNRCIMELQSLSGDVEQIHNENLLAAAIVLRFYEEIDSPLEDNNDNGVLLRVLNIFVSTQLPSADAFPCSLVEMYHSKAPSESQAQYTQAGGLRRACFCVAFRQELYKSFMNQRPFTIPLSRWNSFRTFTPAGDGTWADRAVLFCADVLEYCYGSSETNNCPSTDKGLWRRLSQYAEALSRRLPPSFEPIYTREYFENPKADEIFPEIWFTDGCHATAAAHIELAKMLLVAFDPNLPKFGQGHMASMKGLMKMMRATVLWVCGIALHNRASPSVFVDATMAISACGQYITDEEERRALMEVLKIAECEYVWPTGGVSEKLRRAWEE